MLFSTPLTLLLALAPAVLAAPTRIAMEKRQNGAPTTDLCDLTKAVMPVAPTPLPAVTGTLSHVAVGRGTQNYSCLATPNDKAGAPKAIGALATLYNVTCLTVLAPDVLKDVPAISMSLSSLSRSSFTRSVTLDSNIHDGPESGHHSFTAAGVPLFETAYGTVQAKASGNSPAPEGSSKGKNGLGSVPWLKLGAVQGDFKEIYRLDTSGGVAPKTCEGIEGTFEVQYAALYWFFK
ncbi:hypothetical protein CC80DRAFT_539898 [Byssothecium circinans]|uniref:Malate dehydrogenase n=1 Tax=Byssothecium circinans TaxID=147558 RepID=A0A6A5TCQ0_9PLEO|nr:hypothetical protein CC80DRAFT_539898 [Byssothecium circinans]